MQAALRNDQIELLALLDEKERREKARAAQRRQAELALDRDAIRERCSSLVGFVREAWEVLEPDEPYVHGWHIDAIAEHLEAITKGQINRLLINVPPGTMKSLLTGVLWPAWEWGPQGRRGLRIFGSSYSEDYAKRDSRRMRELVTSDWYQTLWPEVAITKSGETEFHNVARGWRKAVPFVRLTGGRGDRVIVDDPLGSEQAESPAERKRATRIFRESLPSRVINPAQSAIVVIMQRLHQADVSGVILEHVDHFGYEHLMLPMEFEPDRRCSTSIGFTDPRTQEGELLFPGRFPRAVVERDKAIMGSYAVAGQNQQRPSPRGGGMFKLEWFVPISARPANIKRTVRAWDFGATEGGGDYTAAVKMSVTSDGLYIIEHCRRFQGSPFQVELTFKNMPRIDGKKTFVRYPQDPGAAGKSLAKGFSKHLSGYPFKAVRPTGSKEVRAQPFASAAEAGNVRILITGDATKDAWVEPFLDELCLFPAGKHDDQTDAAADAFDELALGAGGYSLEGV